jgi:hypothetical protein
MAAARCTYRTVLSETRATSICAKDEDLICEASALLRTATVVLGEPLSDRQLSGCKTSRSTEKLLVRATCADIQAQA